MNKRIELLNKLQLAATTALENNDFKGTLYVSMRFGKTLTAFKTLYRMLELGLIKKGDTVRFWTMFVTATETMLKDEEEAAIKILGKNPFKDFNLSLKSVQSKITGVEDEAVVEIYDEVDAILSQMGYLTIFNSTAKYKIGLTGTLNRTNSVFVSELDDEMKGNVRQTNQEMKEGKITKNINKGQLLDLILPIVFEYSVSQAIDDGIINSFNGIVIEHSLGTKDKYLIPRGWKTMMSEFDYYQNRESNRRDFSKPKYLRGLAGKDQADLLYNMRSKVFVVNKMLESLKGKTVIFNVRKDPLYKITDNVCEAKTTKQLIEDFRNDKINILASAKMIGRVLSLPRIDNVILMSYYTKNAAVLQQLARALLYEQGRVPNVYFLRTAGTREEQWFDKIQIITDNKGVQTSSFNLNIKQIISSKSLWIKDFKL